MPWTLNGALPAGDWRLLVQGYQPTMDAVVRADLKWRERVVGTVTASATGAVDGGFPGDFSTVILADAVTPSCGDQIALVLTLVSGGSPYNNIEAVLTTP